MHNLMHKEVTIELTMMMKKMLCADVWFEDRRNLQWKSSNSAAYEHRYV